MTSWDDQANGDGRVGQDEGDGPDLLDGRDGRTGQSGQTSLDG